MIADKLRRAALSFAAVCWTAGALTLDGPAAAQEPPAPQPVLTQPVPPPTATPEPSEARPSPAPDPAVPPPAATPEPAAPQAAPATGEEPPAGTDPAPESAPNDAEDEDVGDEDVGDEDVGDEVAGDEDAGDEADLPRRDPLLPRLDVFFPEGDLDLRVSRLINKVFFEGQVKYNFIKGDITAFLRYRYYGYKRTTQFTVFDAIEFADVEDFSSDFDRVRGALMLWQWPYNFHHRTFALVELDRISSNRETVTSPEGMPIEGTLVREGGTNTFVRFGYQVGTPDDSRSNAIAGETRARNQRLFTAAREIGPGGTGFTGAVTYSFDQIGGDFSYLKAEFEALKRFDVTERTFLIGRLSGGSFLTKKVVQDDPRLPQIDHYSIPRGEYFNLEGRDNLKGVGDGLPGTEKVITTWEFFFPWFLGENRPYLRANWQNWYWVLYGGYGMVGFDRKMWTDFSSYTPDVGVGFESSLRIRKYNFFISGILAQALKGGGGPEARFSVKSYR